jgi:hypothetical protein
MKVAYGEHDELELHSCPWIHQWTLLAVEIGVLQALLTAQEWCYLTESCRISGAFLMVMYVSSGVK